MNSQDVTILFAPLQGYTEKFFRDAHRELIGGIAEYYTPFLRLEKGEMRKKDRKDVEPEDSGPQPDTVPQVLVNTENEADFLFRNLLQAGYRRIDLNFGCPFPKIMRQEYGAGILCRPDRIQKIVSVMERFPQIGFSIKMRSGAEDPEDALKLLPLLHRIPLRQIVLHPRTGVMQYRGNPDRALFFRFESECRHPVYYNGEIRSPEDAAPFRKLMIGRGLLADPLLALKIRGKYRTAQEECSLLRQFHRRLFHSLESHENRLEKMKLFWEYFLPESNRKLRKKLEKTHSIQEYMDLAELLLMPS